MVKITTGAINPNPGSSMAYKTGSWRTLKPVVDIGKCIKCYLCYGYCPDSAISKTDSGPVINYDYCKGCGICANECPTNAIEMVAEVK